MTLSTLMRIVTFLVMAMTSVCHDVTVIDLTHQLKEGESIAWPSNPEFNFTILHRGRSALYNTWTEANKFEMPEHMGTHMDAPAHTTKGGKRMHEIPISRLVGEGVVVDVKDTVKSNSMYSVTVEDLKMWESQHGKIPDKAVVLINSGWASRYPDPKKVFNTQNLQDFASYRFPSVTAEAARWLAEEWSIRALGVDTPSPDTGNDFRIPVHKILLTKGILIVENVANLDSLPPKGTTIVLGALNLYDGSGAPMRMMALSGGWRSGPSAVCLAAAVSVGMVMLTLLLSVWG